MSKDSPKMIGKYESIFITKEPVSAQITDVEKVRGIISALKSPKDQVEDWVADFESRAQRILNTEPESDEPPLLRDFAQQMIEHASCVRIGITNDDLFFAVKYMSMLVETNAKAFIHAGLEQTYLKGRASEVGAEKAREISETRKSEKLRRWQKVIDRIHKDHPNWNITAIRDEAAADLGLKSRRMLENEGLFPTDWSENN